MDGLVGRDRDGCLDSMPAQPVPVRTTGTGLVGEPKSTVSEEIRLATTTGVPVLDPANARATSSRRSNAEATRSASNHTVSDSAGAQV